MRFADKVSKIGYFRFNFKGRGLYPRQSKHVYLSTRAIFLLYQFMKADVSRLNVR